MTLEEFIIEFKKSKELFDWKIMNGLIRAVEHQSGLTCCPLTGVCFFLTKILINKMDFRKAAAKIGLPLNIANLIVGAADFDNNNKQCQEVRKQLCAAVGLTKE